jgi:zinc protease
VKIDRLSNGLRLLRLDRPGWPVLTADVWVATGSAREIAPQAGISHFLEHMMFKGTSRRGPGELDRIVEGVGGHWNAGTSKDFTHYYLTVPSEHRTLALDALSDAVLHSVIDPGEVERERQVILEEWRRSEDNPGQLLYQELYQNCFSAGPYRWPVLGTRDTISAITRDQLAAYHAARYRPERMALILAGPVGDAAVVREVEKHFQWNGNSATAPSDATAPAWRDGAVKTIGRPVQEVYLAIAWPGPSAADPKAMIAMDVAQFVLGQGRASRLYQRLHERDRLVTTIAASYPAHATTGLFGVVATCAPEKATATREAILEEVAALAAARPTSEEVARAKRLLINAHEFSRETTSGHTSSLGYHLTLTGDPKFDDAYPELVSRVTTASVTKWVREFLTPESASTTAIHPADKSLEWKSAA